jgi:hypothetical protein
MNHYRVPYLGICWVTKETFIYLNENTFQPQVTSDKYSYKAKFYHT